MQKALPVCTFGSQTELRGRCECGPHLHIKKPMLGKGRDFPKLLLMYGIESVASEACHTLYSGYHSLVLDELVHRQIQ